jgi:tol-pal system protein YbgF
MSLSRIASVLLILAPFAFGANRETLELQRDVAMLQDQVRNLQRSIDEKFSAMQTLVQQTLESVNRTNTAVAVMQSRFNDAAKEQQQGVGSQINTVGSKLDQMSEDFRAVRESVLDMNTRMGKLDAKMADLQNLINTVQRPAAPPPTGTNPAQVVPEAQTTAPPAGVSADATYTNGWRDYNAGKRDLALQEFSDYVKWFPTTALAPNAQYYIGDIYYKNKDYDNALQAFDAVLEHYSDNKYTADAHYMKGLSLLGLGRNDSAAREFRDVYSRYPDTDVAAQAKARLKDMGLPVGSVPSNAKRARQR